MSYKVRYTRTAREDLHRLFAFLVERDVRAAQRAGKAIGASIELLRQFPFTCRKATPDNAFLREMVISFGAAGYVALFEIENDETITILAIRHQSEDDFY